LADLHLQRFGLQLAASARRTLLRRLILTKEHPDVLLVTLLFQRAQKGQNAHVSATGTVQEQGTMLIRQLRPGRVLIYPLAARELRERAPAGLVARLRPWVDCTIPQRALGVGDDQPLIVLQNRTEPVAGVARTSRVVEREELWSGRRGNVTVNGAAEVLREREALDHASGNNASRRSFHRLRKKYHRVAITFRERSGYGVRDASKLFVRCRKPIHHHQQLRSLGEVQILGFHVIPVEHAAVYRHANEALPAEDRQPQDR